MKMRLVTAHGLAISVCLIALPAAEWRQNAADKADVVVRDISVLDPTGSRWLAHRDVVVSATRIASITPTGAPLPAAKYTIDGSGKFAIPGLFDNHVHLARFTRATAGLLVAHGVTSVRDMGTDPERIVQWRREIANGKFTGPRIVSACGPMLEGRGEQRPDHWLVNSPEEAAAVVEKVAASGMDCIKVRTFKDEATYRAIGAAARAQGLMLTGHAPEPLPPLEAIKTGQRTFEHAFYPYPLAKVPAEERTRLVQALIESKAAHVPTLIAWQPATQTTDDLRRRLQAIATDERFRLSEELFAHWQNHLATHEKERRGSPGWKQAVQTAAEDLGVLHRAGALVLPGSDTGSPFVTPGVGLHQELELLVTQAGLTPAEALRRATIDSAAFHNRSEQLGSIQPGKTADLVVLNGDPLADITQTRRIDAVIFRGETFTRAHINKLLSQTLPANPTRER